jgi:hypothetical protein
MELYVMLHLLGVSLMKIRNLLTAITITSASILFSGAALAASPGNIAGVYSLTVCGGAIQGVAILGADGSASIIDSNESALDTTALGVWDKNGQVISGKASFFREGVGLIDLVITNGSYSNPNISASLAIKLGATTLQSCPDLLLKPYN